MPSNSKNAPHVCLLLHQPTGAFHHLVVKSPYNILIHYSSLYLANLVIQQQSLSLPPLSLCVPFLPLSPHPLTLLSIFLSSVLPLKWPMNQRNLFRTKKITPVSKCWTNMSEGSNPSTSAPILGDNFCHWKLISQRFEDVLPEPGICACFLLRKNNLIAFYLMIS